MRAAALFSVRTFLVLILAVSVLMVLLVTWLGLRFSNGEAAAVTVLVILMTVGLGEIIRRKSRVSMRMLLIGATLVAALLGLLSRPLVEARRQRAVVAEIVRHGGRVQYDFTLEDARYGWLRNKQGQMIPTWLVTLGGLDAWSGIWRVQLGPRATDEDLQLVAAELEEVQSLDLTQSRVTDRGLAPIREMETVTELWLKGEQATPTGLKLLHGTHVQELAIDDPGGQDEWLAGLKHLPALNRLSLRFSALGDGGLKHVRSLPHLEGLSIGSASVTDAGLAGLQDLPNLRDIHLERTSITDDGLIALARFPSLRYVRVFRGGATEQGAARLRELLPDCQVSVR